LSVLTSEVAAIWCGVVWCGVVWCGVVLVVFVLTRYDFSFLHYF
jgi:hypothetical protein